MAAAAVAVAFIVVAFFMFKKTDENQLDTIITLATNDHLNDRHLKVETADHKEFCQKIQPELPFEVITPELGQEIRLVGGRPCKIGTHPIVYSLWRSSNNDYSLFQFRLSDYGLPESDSPRMVKPKNSVMEKSPCEVLYWTKNGFGFVLVADHGELLKGVNPK